VNAFLSQGRFDSKEESHQARTLTGGKLGRFSYRKRSCRYSLSVKSSIAALQPLLPQIRPLC